MAEAEISFVDENADGLDLPLRANGQGADRVSSVKDFVDQVLGKLGPDDCIKKLVLIGHGSPGNIGVGSGKEHATTGNKSIDLNNIAQWEPQLRRLRCRFCKPGGEFELRGCNVGAELKGARLLRLITNFIRCARVKAPVGRVAPLSEEQIYQIVEAIGEGVDEHARLPEPIPAQNPKVSIVQPFLKSRTLLAGQKLSELQLYDPSEIVHARFIAPAFSSHQREAERDNDLQLGGIIRCFKAAQIAWCPLDLYAIEGYLQLRVRSMDGSESWLPPGALLGGYALYSPFGSDTTLVYALSPQVRRRLISLARRSTR